MMIASPRARWLVAIIALVLLLPILGIYLQDPVALDKFHRRSLQAWPATPSFASNPVQYFAQARGWLRDRVYPIQQASLFANRFLYFALHTPPMRNITFGEGGSYFLNGGNEANVNGILESVCITAHTPEMAQGLTDSLAALAPYARGAGIPFDVLVIPTSATLYGERVPPSVPPRIRNACRERARGGSPLLGVRAPPEVNYQFPFQPMQAASGDDAFFPKGNFHAKGLSLRIVRDTYLASLHQPLAVDESLQLGTEPAEVLKRDGVFQDLPVYILRNDHVRLDTTRTGPVTAAVADLFPNRNPQVRFFHNEQPTIPQTVLMLSDSYGVLTSETFAGAFRNVIQLPCNFLAPERIAEVIERVSRIEPIDRVILLTEEGQAGMIVAWSRALASADPHGVRAATHGDRIFRWRD